MWGFIIIVSLLGSIFELFCNTVKLNVKSVLFNLKAINRDSKILRRAIRFLR